MVQHRGCRLDRPSARAAGDHRTHVRARPRRVYVSGMPWQRWKAGTERSRALDPCFESVLANRTIIGAFAAQPAMLRIPDPRPHRPRRLPKHVRYQTALRPVRIERDRMILGRRGRTRPRGRPATGAWPPMRPASPLISHMPPFACARTVEDLVSMIRTRWVRGLMAHTGQRTHAQEPESRSAAMAWGSATEPVALTRVCRPSVYRNVLHHGSAGRDQSKRLPSIFDMREVRSPYPTLRIRRRSPGRPPYLGLGRQASRLARIAG